VKDTLEILNLFLKQETNKSSDTKTNFQPNSKPNKDETNLFSLDKFIKNISEKSKKKHFDTYIFSSSITAYDIAVNCIRQVVYRLLDFPIRYYEDLWLPIIMRQFIGNAIHEFIQSNYEFTEVEVPIKVKEFNFSGRIDALIGKSALVEIKSVSFQDYEEILKTNKPREKDLMQTIIYTHLLNDYFDKVDKENYSFKYDSYNIKYIQFIYIAHDIVAKDIDNIEECLEIYRNIKKQLKSFFNKFYFIKVITYSIDENIDEFNTLKARAFDKLMEINKFIKKHIIPPLNHKYINTNYCNFCPYKHLCNK